MRDYLESLPPYNPDGRSLLWGLARFLWLLNHEKHSHGQHDQAAMAMWDFLYVAVSRTYQSEPKQPVTLVLEGPEGIGKSAILRQLLPDTSMFFETTWPTGHVVSNADRNM